MEETTEKVGWKVEERLQVQTNATTLFGRTGADLLCSYKENFWLIVLEVLWSKKEHSC